MKMNEACVWLQAAPYGIVRDGGGGGHVCV